MSAAWFLLGLSTIKGSKATDALRGIPGGTHSDTVAPDTTSLHSGQTRELTQVQNQSKTTITSSTTSSSYGTSSGYGASSSYGTYCVKRRYDELRSCLDDDTRCFVFNLYYNNDFTCDELGDFYKFVCPCQSLCDEYQDETEFRYDYCSEFAYGCRRACRKYMTNCCDYPNACQY